MDAELCEVSAGEAVDGESPVVPACDEVASALLAAIDRSELVATTVDSGIVEYAPPAGGEELASI